MIFHPDDITYSKIMSYDYDEVYFFSSDKTRLHAWHLHPKTKSKGLVFIVHGNAQNLSAHILDWIWIVDAGYELFMMDYRGYGKSDGEVELKGAIEDVIAGLEYVNTHHNQPFIAIGQSLGGALLINALANTRALHVKIKTTVIDSTYSDLQKLAKEILARSFLTWPFQWSSYLLLSGDFNPIDKLDAIHVPLLFVAGSQDNMISANHSWELFDKAQRPKAFWLVKNAGHINSFTHPKMRQELLDFLNRSDFSQEYSIMKIYDNLDKIAPSSTKVTQ